MRRFVIVKFSSERGSLPTNFRHLAWHGYWHIKWAWEAALREMPYFFWDPRKTIRSWKKAKEKDTVAPKHWEGSSIYCVFVQLAYSSKLRGWSNDFYFPVVPYLASNKPLQKRAVEVLGTNRARHERNCQIANRIGINLMLPHVSE